MSLEQSAALDATTVDVPRAASVAALDATIAAPRPNVTQTVTKTRTSLTTATLPRLEFVGDAIRLVDNDGPRYAESRVLGAGGMGEVALAEDRDIGRQVALKRLHPPPPAQGQTQAPAVLARFVDEVRTVGQLEHPNIVPIHDVGVDEKGNYFFVMKYLDGQSLEAIIDDLRAGKPEAVAKYTFHRRLEIFVGVMHALEYAHGRGIIHRDIKPANVMVGNNGEVVLMDWGVARPVRRPEADAQASPSGAEVSRASATHVGALIGTPLYMSPEQARGKNSSVDARSDLYSACQMFYELLCLHHRFEDKDNLMALLMAIQTTGTGSSLHEFIAPHFAAAKVPAEFAHFLRKGLALEPDARWQSASEIIYELGLIADGRVHVQCPATGMKRTSREFARLVDRSPAGAGALVAMTLMTLLGLVALAAYGLMT